MTRSPQTFDSLTSLRLHLTLIGALLPVALFASLKGGWGVAFVVISTVLVGWLTDLLLRRMRTQPVRDDASAALWGLCLALLMPPSIPFWVPWVGIVFALVGVKTLMGGSGSPWVNPVLIAWALCQAGWPTLMQPGQPVATGRSGFDLAATDWLNGNLLSWLNIQLPAGYVDLVSGLGSQPHSWNAEAGTLFLLLATVFLLVRGTIPWQVPLAFFVGFALPVAIFGGLPSGGSLLTGDVLVQVFSGTFLLGIFFLATETSSRPLTEVGLVIYALGAGVLSFLLRTWGGHSEGVGYAILFMNFLVPWLDSVLRKKTLNDLR